MKSYKFFNAPGVFPAHGGAEVNEARKISTGQMTVSSHVLQVFGLYPATAEGLLNSVREGEGRMI